MRAALKRLTRECVASITNRGKTRLQSYRGQRVLVFLELSRSAAFRVSGAIAVSDLTLLWSYRGQRQIVTMEGEELIQHVTEI